MKRIITCTLFGLLCLLLNSCREAEELSYLETASDKNIILKNTSKPTDSSNAYKDPPIKGTHWKQEVQ